MFYRRIFCTKRRSARRYVLLAGAALLFLGALFGGYVGFLQLTGNFHTVLAGVLYRSSQPSSEQIASYKDRYGIQSIINLRGDNTGSPWYDEEVSASQKLGIKHINFRMSARRELSFDQAVNLILTLRNAPKPVLVHCMSGSDRSGLAAALYLAAIEKKGEDASEDQISIRFGHVPIPYLSSAFAMDQTFEDLESWLGYSDS
ncbi:MAG: tyrosine-protein phosphatase [Alphaproteobacteria bacterium]|nr:tyrosine-protein phosphatase [Alphaproteobacteria bacterium]